MTLFFDTLHLHGYLRMRVDQVAERAVDTEAGGLGSHGPPGGQADEWDGGGA